MFAERSMTRQEFTLEYGFQPQEASTVVQFLAPNGIPILRVHIVPDPDPASKMEVEWLEKLYSL